MEITYEDKVFKYIIDAPLDTPLSIAVLTKEQTRQRFIDAIKWFIESRYGYLYGFDIDFNSDYTKFRKYKVIVK